MQSIENKGRQRASKQISEPGTLSKVNRHFPNFSTHAAHQTPSNSSSAIPSNRPNKPLEIFPLDPFHLPVFCRRKIPLPDSGTSHTAEITKGILLASRTAQEARHDRTDGQILKCRRKILRKLWISDEWSDRRFDSRFSSFAR